MELVATADVEVAPVGTWCGDHVALLIVGAMGAGGNEARSQMIVDAAGASP